LANRTAIAHAVKARPRVANGGTSAPKSAAGGIGVYNNRVAPNPGRVGGNRPVAKPKSGAGAAGAPAAPYTGAPWDSQYELSSAGATSKYNNANIGLDYKEQAYKQDYGLDAGFNDYKTNPYSRASLLEQSYQRANRGSTNSYAAAGQLYAGSTQNALGYNRDAVGQERDQLQKSYSAALQGVSAERLAASDRKNEEINNAGWSRLERAEGEPLDPTTSPPGKAKAKKPAGKKAAIKQAVSSARALPRRKR